MNKNNIIICLLIVFSHLVYSQNIPPTIEAEGDQIYCPLSQMPVVTNFNIDDPDDTQIEALYIQISTGYQEEYDMLILNGSHPNIVTSWDATQGKLTLSGIGGAEVLYTDLISAVYDVVFQNSNIDFENSNLNIVSEKTFSFTIGDANFLPSTGHYYEFISDLGITWSQAKIAAENSTYFGLQGYLATISSSDESQLCGEQAAGNGWIGGSDEETEGVWKWMTGPEEGTVFWNGTATGSSPNFAFWNTGEPNDLEGEDYAHVTAPGIGITGSWNDLANTGGGGDYMPQGYIVEYGGMPGDPNLDLSASTSLIIPEIIAISGDTGCGSESLQLHAEASVGTVIWFDADGNQLGSGEDFNTPILNTSTNFYAMASYGGCMEGEKVAAAATINPLPTIISPITYKNCDEDGVPDGFTDFNLDEIANEVTNGQTSGYYLKYYINFNDADNNVNQINPYPFNNSTSDTIYIRIEGQNGCYDIATVHLEVSTTSFPQGYMEIFEHCDDDGLADGLHEFDLSDLDQSFIDQFPSGQNLSVHYYTSLNDAQLELNEIDSSVPYVNPEPFQQEIFVRVESSDNGDCFGLGPHLSLVVHPQPQFNVDPESFLCSNDGPITLEIYNPDGNYSYEWTDSSGSVIGNSESISINSGGSYFVSASSGFGCVSEVQEIQVQESSIATITENDLIVTDFIDNNSISINTQDLGPGDYEYSIESASGYYQDDPYFDNLSYGDYTLYVRDKNGCGMTSIEFMVLGTPSFFTPNGDGEHDAWNITGLNNDYSSNSHVEIFDKYGKLLKTISPFSEGWNGLYNGKKMPNSDYWFIATMIKSTGEIKIKTGHFTLKR